MIQSNLIQLKKTILMKFKNNLKMILIKNLLIFLQIFLTMTFLLMMMKMYLKIQQNKMIMIYKKLRISLPKA